MNERTAIMGVRPDGDGGALVSDTGAPSRRAETFIDGAESELHATEMETTPITEDKQNAVETNYNMNRSLSTPTDSKVCANAEELKELFTDPAFRKKKSGTSRKTSEVSSSFSDICDASEAESGATAVKVADPAIRAAGNHLVTRRITIAGGFLDIALFTANCEQLKFILELGTPQPYYYQVLGLLITSLVLQLLVGLTLFLLGCQVMHKEGEETYSNFLNHATMGLVALITIVNIFISTFGPKGTVMARCFGFMKYANISTALLYQTPTSNCTAIGNTH